MSDGVPSLERLSEAAAIVLAWRERGCEPALPQLLDENEDLRDLIEAMLDDEDIEDTDVLDADPDDAFAGRRLGDFDVVGEIGRGAMGVVVHARHRSLGRDVAIKILPSGVELSSRALARFRREAALVARLDHEGIVEVFDVGEHEGLHYYVMELVDGAPLSDVLDVLHDGDRTWGGEKLASVVGELVDASRTRGRSPSDSDTRSSSSQRWASGFHESVVRIVEQLADALHHAHEAGVIHRDVKPSNVLLRRDGRVVLTDFGLAREAGLPSQTRTGEFAGTPYYVSPEQALGRADALDRRTDVFSLGVTLYELLTGKRPFEAGNSHEVLQLILTEDPIDPSVVAPSVPRDLAAVVLRALEKDPDRRYATAHELAEDLRAFRRGDPVVARHLSGAERLVRAARRNRAITIAAAVVLLGIGTAAGVVWWNDRVQQERIDEARAEADASADQAIASVERLLDRVSDLDLESLPGSDAMRRATLEQGLEELQRLMELRPTDDRLKRKAMRGYLALQRLILQLGDDETGIDVGNRLIALFDELEIRRSEDHARVLWARGGLLNAQFAEKPGDVYLEAARELIAAIDEAEAQHGERSVFSAVRANTLMRMAAASNEIQANDERDELNEQARRVAAELVELRGGRRDDRSLLGQILFERGMYHMTDREFDDSLKSFAAAMAMFETLIEEYPETAHYQSRLMSVGMSYGSVLRRQREFDTAREILGRTVEVGAELWQRFPDRPWFAHRLGGVAHNLATLHLQFGELDDATERVDEAIEAQAFAKTRLTTTKQVEVFWANHRVLKARIEMKLGHHRGLGELLSTFAPARNHDPRSYVYASRLSAQRLGVLAADDAVDEAERAVLEDEYRSATLAWLREAVDRGLDNPRELQSAAFADVRDDPEFKELAAIMQDR